MTLLTTEIHNHDDKNNALIVYAADRRLSRSDGSAGPERVKVMRISGLNGGIGYFGLAQVPAGTTLTFMDDWLAEFMISRPSWASLREFAAALAVALNAAVPKDWRESTASGLHVAGFEPDGRIEFWYVRNIDDRGEPTLGGYQAREDFQREHAPMVPENGYWIYRNGDIRAHVAAWSEIDESLGRLLGTPHFRVLRTPADYVEWVKFKMETIAGFYETFATRSIIARPVDAFVITPQV